MRCFTTEPRPVPGDAFYLGFAGSLGGSALRFRLTTTSPAGIGIHPQTPPLAVEAWSGEAWVTVLRLFGHDGRAQPGRRGRLVVPTRP